MTEIEEDSDGKQTLKPKMFKKEIELIKDGLLLDKSDIVSQVSTSSIDNNYAEYFFDIKVDNSIEEDLKYKYIVSRDGKANIFDSAMSAQQYAQEEGDVLYTSDNSGEDC